jgi:hypothetical protein
MCVYVSHFGSDRVTNQKKQMQKQKPKQKKGGRGRGAAPCVRACGSVCAWFALFRSSLCCLCVSLCVLLRAWLCVRGCACVCAFACVLVRGRAWACVLGRAWSCVRGGTRQGTRHETRRRPPHKQARRSSEARDNGNNRESKGKRRGQKRRRAWACVLVCVRGVLCSPFRLLSYICYFVRAFRVMCSLARAPFLLLLVVVWWAACVRAQARGEGKQKKAETRGTRGGKLWMVLR